MARTVFQKLLLPLNLVAFVSVQILSDDVPLPSSTNGLENSGSAIAATTHLVPVEPALPNLVAPDPAPQAPATAAAASASALTAPMSATAPVAPAPPEISAPSAPAQAANIPTPGVSMPPSASSGLVTTPPVDATAFGLGAFPKQPDVPPFRAPFRQAPLSAGGSDVGVGLSGGGSNPGTGACILCAGKG